MSLATKALLHHFYIFRHNLPLKKVSGQTCGSSGLGGSAIFEHGLEVDLVHAVTRLLEVVSQSGLNLRRVNLNLPQSAKVVY